MAGEILRNLVPQKEEDIQAVSELTKIRVSGRFPESQIPPPPLPSEIPIEQIAAGPSLLNPFQIPRILRLLVTSPLRAALRENLLLAFEEIDPKTGTSYLSQLEAILKSRGISSETIPWLRVIASQALAIGLAPTTAKEDLEKTRQCYQVEEKSPAGLLLRDIQASMDELKPGESWLVKGQAGNQMPFPPYLQIIRQVLPPGFSRKITNFLEELSLRTGVCELRVRGPEVYLYEKINQVFQPVFQPLVSRFSQSSLGKSLKAGSQKLGEAGIKVFWKTGQQGIKKAAVEMGKKAALAVSAKLGLTALATIVGTPLGGLATFIVTTLGPKVLKKLGRLASWPFRFLKNLSPFGGEKTQRVVTGINDFCQQLTAGEFLGATEKRLFPLAFAGVFIVLFVLSWFFKVAPLRAFLGIAFPSETRFRGPLEQLPGRIPLKSKSLDTIFAEVAQKYCVPKAFLLAISQIEAPQVWNYSQGEVDQFIKAGWWEESGCKMSEKVPGDCTLGYCYDTCQVYPELNCSAYSVVGPMQFELGTWNEYLDRLGNDLKREPHRCNLEDSVFAAGIKIKENSRTGNDECAIWNETTVKQTARAYCGSCGVEAECGNNPLPECEAQNRPCGVNYCEAVWKLYNEYQ